MWTGLQIETRGEVGGGGGLVGGTYIRCQCCHFERRKEGTLHHSTAAFPCEWTGKTPKLFNISQKHNLLAASHYFTPSLSLYINTGLIGLPVRAGLLT